MLPADGRGTMLEMTERPADDPRLTRIHLRYELIDAGWHDRALAREVSTGVLAKPRRGAYVDGRDWRQLDGSGRHEVTARAVLRQAHTDLALSHVSAVPFHCGPTWGLDLTQVHVTRLDAKSGRDECGVHQHVGLLAEGDVVDRYGVSVICAARNALELTTMVGTEAALAVVNDYLHRGLFTPDQLRQRYDDGFAHWPRTLATDLVIRLASPLLESVGESRFFYLCYAQGLPAPQPQFKVRDATGEIVAVLDFAWPELGAFAEFDGKIKYQKLLRPGESPSDVVFREKRREDLIRELTGFRGMRVVWTDLDLPHHTAVRIRRLLTSQTRSSG